MFSIGIGARWKVWGRVLLANLGLHPSTLAPLSDVRSNFEK
jgi:hypothetical protein